MAMGEKNNMTIEEMIAAGASWEQIKARINDLQREQKAKKAAEEAAKRANAEEQIATERLAVATQDWALATGVAESKEEAVEIGKEMMRVAAELVKEFRQLKRLEAYFTNMFEN